MVLSLGKGRKEDTLMLSLSLFVLFLFSQRSCTLFFMGLEQWFLSKGRKRAKSRFQTGYQCMKWLSHISVSLSSYNCKQEGWTRSAVGLISIIYTSCCCSVTKLCPTLCDPMDCSIPGSSVLHYPLELAQTHVHWISGAIQPSYPLSSPSPSAFNLSQHQGLFQWVGSLHQVAKVLELQLRHQSFQWIFRTDFL